MCGGVPRVCGGVPGCVEVYLGCVEVHLEQCPCTFCISHFEMINSTCYGYLPFRRLYDEAMTKGYAETSVTKCLIVGAAGVGKTHLKHLLLKKDPPEQRVSTGLADNPVRAISFTLAGVGGQEEDDWFVVEDEQALMSLIIHG